MLKKVLFRVIPILFGIVFIVVLDLSIRVLFPSIQSQCISENLFEDSVYAESPVLRKDAVGYANGVEVKTDQFRLRKTSTPIDTTKPTLLIIGDSVTMGIGVEGDSTFAGILASNMDSVNIINPSVIGYAVDDYYNVIQYYLYKQTSFSISEIYLFYCLNDIKRSNIQNVNENNNMGFLKTSLGFLRCYSRIYIILKNILSDRAEAYYLYDKQFYEYRNEYFLHTVNILQEIAKLCKETDVKLSFVLLPYEYQLRQGYSDTQSPQSILQEKLSDSLKVLNPIEYLKARSENSKNLYLYSDGIHFSNTGHRLIAKYFYENYNINR